MGQLSEARQTVTMDDLAWAYGPQIEDSIEIWPDSEINPITVRRSGYGARKANLGLACCKRTAAIEREVRREYPHGRPPVARPAPALD